MQVLPQAVCSCNITQPQQAENGEDSRGSLKLCLLLSWWKVAVISDEVKKISLPLSSLKPSMTCTGGEQELTCILQGSHWDQ